MKIYFSGAIRGGRQNLEYYQVIIEQLQKYGEVLNPLAGSKMLFSKEETLTDHEIYEADLEKIEECDLLVAEITQPSLGVGYEIGHAELTNKKMMVFFRTNAEKRLSVMITGNTKVVVHKYTSKDEIVEYIDKLFADAGIPRLLDGDMK